MFAPALFLVLSLLGAVYALITPAARDALLLALPVALASLVLLWRAIRRRPQPGPRPGRRWRRPSILRGARGRHILIDGSNVLHWHENRPQIAPLRVVIDRLTRQGYTPSVIFDANAGYKLGGAYLHDDALARALGLPAARVFVVPRGQPADPAILTAARDSGARIVTNDRYREWLGTFPEAAEPGRLVRGRYNDGQVWLDL